MILCAGLERLSKEGKGWATCPREAIRGDRFCAVHRDALDGAILGLLGREKNLHAIQILFEEEAAWRRSARWKERWHRDRARHREKRRLEPARQATVPKEAAPAPKVTAAAPESP